MYKRIRVSRAYKVLPRALKKPQPYKNLNSPPPSFPDPFEKKRKTKKTDRNILRFV